MTNEQCRSASALALLHRKIGQFFLMLALVSTPLQAKEEPRATPKVPPKVPHGKTLNSKLKRVRLGRLGRTKLRTVLTDKRKPLRGSAIIVFKHRRDQILPQGRQEDFDYIYDDQYWDDLVDRGINAIRLVAFDPWQQSHGEPGSATPYPFTDLKDLSELRPLLRDFDKVVAMAESRGMYVMINYHDTGGFRDPVGVAGPDQHFNYSDKITYVIRFWAVVARRYADKAHVFYELTNEPVKWHPNDYKTIDVLDLMRIYTMVRRNAPDTHLVLGSFATTASFNNRTMLTIAREMQLAGVTFGNESIGFHPYQLQQPYVDKNGVRRFDLLEPLWEVSNAGISVLNTEQNFPSSWQLSNDPESPPLRWNHRTGVQSMEWLGTSWFHWNTTGPKEFPNLLMLEADARTNRYFWHR